MHVVGGYLTAEFVVLLLLVAVNDNSGGGSGHINKPWRYFECNHCGSEKSGHLQHRSRSSVPTRNGMHSVTGGGEGSEPRKICAQCWDSHKSIPWHEQQSHSVTHLQCNTKSSKCPPFRCCRPQMPTVFPSPLLVCRRRCRAY